MDEEDRAAILRRRALLVASALASLAAVGCHEDGATPHTDGKSATAEGSTPQPCLTASPTVPKPPEQETTATADAGTDDAGSQGGSATAKPTSPPAPPPTPCLSQKPPPPPPMPCLSPPAPKR